MDLFLEEIMKAHPAQAVREEGKLRRLLLATRASNDEALRPLAKPERVERGPVQRARTRIEAEHRRTVNMTATIFDRVYSDAIRPTRRKTTKLRAFELVKYAIEDACEPGNPNVAFRPRACDLAELLSFFQPSKPKVAKTAVDYVAKAASKDWAVSGVRTSYISGGMPLPDWQSPRMATGCICAPWQAGRTCPNRDT